MRATPQELETLPLQELLSYWTGMLWWIGMRPVLQRMLDADLTMSEGIVMHGLQCSPLSVAEVADCLRISPSAASRAVDRLVHDGFISRQEDPDDRRQKVLTLTLKGAGLVGECDGILALALRPLVAALSPDEQEQLRSLLLRIMVPQSAGVDCGSSSGCLDRTAVEQHKQSKQEVGGLPGARHHERV